MKLYLNNSQKDYLLEILKASENNAINGKDAELANAFNNLYEKIKPTNCAFINLNREESEIIVEFCEIVRKSLDKALSFLEKDLDRDITETRDLSDKAISARNDIDEIIRQLQEKIRENPV